MDVYPVSVRYSLDLMGFLLRSKRPRTVRICSQDPWLVRAIVRRVGLDGYELRVVSQALQRDVADTLGVDVAVGGDGQADAALCPNLAQDPVPTERILVGATTNALSYRSFRHPGSAAGNAIRLVRRVKRDYRLDRVVGLYPPRFVARFAAAQLTSAIRPELSTRLEDRALQDLVTFGPAWRLSYIVVVAGER